MKRRTARGIGVFAGVAAVVLLLAYCVSGDNPTGTGSSHLAFSSQAAPSSEVSARIQGALAKVEWIGRIHNQAMQEARAQLRTLLAGNGTRRERLCRAAFRITLKYVPFLDKAAGISRSADETQEVAMAAIRQQKRCANVPASSIFAERSSRRVSLKLARVDDDTTATGAYESYLTNLQYGFDASDGYPTSVTSAVNTVLANGSGLGQADYDVLAGAGALAIASSQVWAETESSSGFSGANCTTISHVGDCDEYETSLFSRRQWSGRLGLVKGMGWIDLGGAIAGMAVAWVSGERNKDRLINIGGICGLGASVLAFLALFI